MLKKWQQQQHHQQLQQQEAPDGSIPATLSFDAFAAEASRLNPTRTLASTVELYSVYRTMQAQSRSPKLCLAPNYGCLCFTINVPSNQQEGGSPQYVVPVSKQSMLLSMGELVTLLQAVEPSGSGPRGVLIATVDGDGSFSVARMHASLQPPQGQ